MSYSRPLTSNMVAKALERVTGIEPVSTAWKAAALPLCYTRPAELGMVPRAGFEPAIAGLKGRRPSPLDERGWA